MKKALLIGINYINDTDIRLQGCIEDVINIRNMLIDAYDYELSNIITLRDDDKHASHQPTRDNIMNNFKKLANESDTIEELWVHYSGHGSLLFDNKPINMNKNNENILVPVDYKTKGFILDIEFLEIIKTIKCKTILLFDSCHSGTMCDLPWAIEYKNPLNYTVTHINNVVISNPNIFMFSGSKDSQTSVDSYNRENQQYVGAFTNAFIHSLRKNRHNVAYKVLYQDICEYLMQHGFTQIPIFSSSSKEPNLIFTRASGLKVPIIMTKPALVTNASNTAIKKNMSFMLRNR
jgi:hypothetical protein